MKTRKSRNKRRADGTLRPTVRRRRERQRQKREEEIARRGRPDYDPRIDWPERYSDGPY